MAKKKSEKSESKKSKKSSVRVEIGEAGKPRVFWCPFQGKEYTELMGDTEYENTKFKYRNNGVPIRPSDSETLKLSSAQKKLEDGYSG